jgi:hypothetical protein
MFDANSAIVGFLASISILVILPFYLIHKETKEREGRENLKSKQMDD